jgi:apolipoprotein N-acyltransferase
VPELLPGEASGPARGRAEDDLSGLRLTAPRPRAAAPADRPASARRSWLRRGRLLALALAGGLLLYAGHPPVGAAWVAPAALVPLLVLARAVAAGSAAPVRSGFGWGLVAGLAFFGPLLVWLRNVQLEAWPLLAGTQAVFVGLFVAGLAAWAARRLPAFGVAAVVWWVAVEATRSELPLGGFGWGVLGYTQAGGGVFLGVARTAGVLGVSALLAGVAAGLEAVGRTVVTHLRDEGVRDAETVFAAARLPLSALLILPVAGILLGGDPPATTQRTVDVAAIQGFDLEGSTGRALPRSIRVADRMLALTAAEVAGPAGPPDLVVWPENAIDGDISQPYAEELRARVEQALEVIGDAPLVAGQILDEPGVGGFRNTVTLFDGSIDPVAQYTKRQYVPFGEYIPFRRLLGWYPPLRRVPSDGVPGKEPGVLPAGPTRVGAVICFEVIFPNLVHEQVLAGADLLVVATNNSSFGRGAASDQHIAFSRLRAVETGRWVLHAALSGKSALVDPQGGVHQETGLFEQAVVRAEIPLVEELTLATRLHGIFGGSPSGRVAQALALAGLLVLLSRRRRVAAPAGDGYPTPGRAASADAPVI